MKQECFLRSSTFDIPCSTFGILTSQESVLFQLMSWRSSDRNGCVECGVVAVEIPTVNSLSTKES